MDLVIFNDIKHLQSFLHTFKKMIHKCATESVAVGELNLLHGYTIAGSLLPRSKS